MQLVIKTIVHHVTMKKTLHLKTENRKKTKIREEEYQHA
ncbi:hypothetical protein BN997_02994 [Oceanobacillus oncorhynchi]|uniref:Uncharacterized protein n=1 Tax=Oceanobacillus oncorhynchi TaxID=545501 RepID=A0A0A1MTU9_9BACI|nr:hypothetical protein BN997_02994 [Oceanobacillus oncorhynchi]